MSAGKSFRIGPLSLARMFWKRRFSFLAVWLVFSAAATVIVLRLPAIYKADTTIMVESQRIPEKFVASTVNADLRDRLSTLSQQILGYRRLLELVEKYDLYHDARKNHAQEEIIEMMRADISTQVEDNWMSKARPDSRPSAFRISFQGANPTVVALVANQLGNFFIDENLRSRETQAQGTSEFLQTQLDEAKRRLEDQEAKLSEYKLKYNGELPQQEAALIATISQLQVRLQGINDSIERAEQNQRLLDSSLASARASETALAELATQINNPEAAAAPGAMLPNGEREVVKPSERLEEQLAQLRTQYNDTFPPVKALISQIANAKREEEARAKKLQDQADAATVAAANKSAGRGLTAPVPTMSKNPRTVQLSEALLREHERVTALVAQQEVSTTQVQAFTADRKDVLARIAETEQRIGRLPVREQQMVGLNRDYEISKANYQSLLDKRLSAEMSTEMERSAKSERFTIIDAARVPDKPVKPDRPVLIGLGCAVGLLFGLIVSVGREFKKAELLGDWELPKGLPVLGRVPSIQPVKTAVALPPSDRVPRRIRLNRKVLGLSFAFVLVLMMIATAVGFYLGKIRI
jgi:polysaccharide biosynthesis transport protein